MPGSALWPAMPRRAGRGRLWLAGSSDNPSGRIAPLAPVAQWTEQPPPKGQVGRSIRLRGATSRLENPLDSTGFDAGFVQAPVARRKASIPVCEFDSATA